MIDRRIAPSYRMCNCCNDNNAFAELQFRKNCQGVEIALCKKCLKELSENVKILLSKSMEQEGER